MFLEAPVLGMAGIGPGDDVARLGRFITHDGRQRNKPLARFGNIAMMHDNAEPIEIAPGRHQVGLLVECRSLSAFSGSPVFVYPDVAGRPDRTIAAAPFTGQSNCFSVNVNGIVLTPSKLTTRSS